MFAVVLPKGRDLVFVSSMTRVDLGQQEQMKEHMNEEPEVWSEWVHECRLTLMRAELDWGIHMGHQGKEKPGTPTGVQCKPPNLVRWLEQKRTHAQPSPIVACQIEHDS